jgi:sugar O-acyltransferase (sialic acid O-acetyltransferase NeuD family)
MKPIVIFGTGELAQLAYFYFAHDSSREVVAFTVDARYAKEPSHLGLPLIAFETLHEHYPPAEFDLFVAIGYSQLNAAREACCVQARARGYTLASYVSSRASTWPDLRVGENCLIMEGNVFQPFVSIGDGVIMFAGSLVSHHVTIGDWAFVGSEATIAGGVSIGLRSFLGVNCTIREHLRVGADCIVGAGALILADVPDGRGFVAAGTKDSGIPSRRLRSLL